MPLTKTRAPIAIPSTFRAYRFHGHVADASSPTAGKLHLRFVDDAGNDFGGFLEDVPDAVLTQVQRGKLRAHLKTCLAYWQEQAGVTGTPEADTDEPTP